MEVIRHGKYKSAVEPFLENKMSVNNRTQISSFLNAIWFAMITDIAESRTKTIEELNTIANGLLGRNVSLAIENNLIDGAIYMDEYTEKLKLAVGVSPKTKLNTISIKNYISTGKGRIISTVSNRIAVIFAQGEIIYGKGNEDVIGQELIINALRKARKSKSVKAIVLRVNSPGGSALTSELIWREIELTKKELPVVVSMGNVAASGGYYIACNANKIFAESTTITGSIGVFGVIPNVQKLAENIGINAEQVSTNSSASYSAFEPMTDAFKMVTQEGVEQVYNTFLNRVAAGRNMTVKQVDSIAQGRVWSGVEAKEIGLVDELGGLKDAVIEAAGLAGITDYRIRNYPSYNIDFEDRFNNLPFVSTKKEILIEEFGEVNYKIYQTIKQFSKISGIQTRLPYIIDIK
jgi:protease-4